MLNQAHPKYVSIGTTLLSLEHLCLTGYPRKECKELCPYLPHFKESWFPMKKVKAVLPRNIFDSCNTGLKWQQMRAENRYPLKSILSLMELKLQADFGLVFNTTCKYKLTCSQTDGFKNLVKTFMPVSHACKFGPSLNSLEKVISKKKKSYIIVIKM